MTTEDEEEGGGRGKGTKKKRKDRHEKFASQENTKNIYTYIMNRWGLRNNG